MTEFRGIIHPGQEIRLGLIEAERVMVTDLLGTGGFGTVWKVKKLPDGKNYALKHIRLKVKDPAEAADLAMKIQTEANIRIDSPYIVRAYGLSKLGPLDYGILFEFVKGQELDEWIIRNASLPWEEKKAVFLRILEGISTAHKGGVVHKDLKPENILVTKNNTPKILDFGLAKIKDQRLTETGDLSGTLPYMAPESFAGMRSNHQFDIYAAGCILYLMVKGKNYCEVNGFDHPPFVKMVQKDQLSKGSILDFGPKFNHPDKSVPSAIQKSTTFNPKYRFKDTDEFINHLSTKQKTRRSCVTCLWIVLAILLILAFVYIFLLNSNGF
jgi:serine/threonine protein kinase